MRRAVLSLLSVLLLTSCRIDPDVYSHSCDAPARRHVPFVDRLRCDRLRVDIGDRVTIPPLRPPGTTLLVSGGTVAGTAELQSFDYDDTDLGADGGAIAEADSRKFAPDGSVHDRSVSVFYRGTPHLYRNDRLVVIYAGDDRAMLDVLVRLLGPQFAGG